MGRPDTAQVLSAGSGSGPDGGNEGQTTADGPAPGSAGPVQAVVLSSAGQARRYRMYEATNITPEGATLVGGLLLEANEEVALELRMPDGALRAGARVVEILLGSAPAMRVVWTGLADADRRLLHR